MKKNFCDLKLNQKAVIVDLKCNGKMLRTRLLDMGLVRGTEFFVKKISPFGDPVVIELRGYELCIRKDEMKDVVVEVEK